MCGTQLFCVSLQHTASTSDLGARYCSLFLENWPTTMPRFNGTQCIPMHPNASSQVFTSIHSLFRAWESTPNPPGRVPKARPRLGSLHRSPRIRYQHLRPVPGQCDAVGQRRPTENVGHSGSGHVQAATGKSPHASPSQRRLEVCHWRCQWPLHQRVAIPRAKMHKNARWLVAKWQQISSLDFSR